MNLQHKDMHYVVSEAQVELYLLRLLILNTKKEEKKRKSKYISSYISSICMITMLALNLWIFQLYFKNKNEVSSIWWLTMEIFPKLNANAMIYISHLCNCIQHTR